MPAPKTVIENPRTFKLPVRVYYEDTDAAQIVYHGSFIRWAERGRTEYLREVGFNHTEIDAEHNLHFAVRHMDINFVATAKLDDLLEVKTSVTSCGNTSITMDQIVTRGDKVLAKLVVTVVGITPEGKPARIPPQLRQILVASS